MKKKSIKLNYIYNTSYQVLTLLTPLITTPYLTRVLGMKGIGISSFTGSIVAYFAMAAALGTLTYGNREISFYQDDRKNRSKLFWEIEFLSILTSLISLVAFGIFLLIQQPEYLGIFAIQSLTIISVAVDICWLLQGMEDFGKVALRNIIFRLLNIACIFIFVKGPDDVFPYVSFSVILTLLGHLSIWFYLPQYVDRPVLKELHPLRHLKGTFILFVPTIAISIYTQLDKTMIGLLSDVKQNGFYESALSLSKTILTLVTSLGAVMIPRMGYHYSRGEEKEMKELVYQSYHFVWFLGIPLCLGLASVAGNFVPWFYAKKNIALIPLLQILSLLIPIIGLSNVTGIQYLVTVKKEKLLTISVCLGALTNCVCNIFLIPYLGARGAAISSVIAELSITIFQFILLRNELSFGRAISHSWKYLLAGGIMYLVLFFENKLFTPSILHTLVLVGTGAISYFVVLGILRDSLFFEYAKTIVLKIKKMRTHN